MAIQMRRGEYEDFTPEKMLPGEWAVVLDGDPAVETGRSVYICFSAGIVKRITTYEDFEIELSNCMEEVQAEFTAEIREAIADALEATESANKATDAANSATSAANAAAETAEEMIKKLEEEINDIVWTINDDDLGLDVTIYDDYQS